MLHFAQKVSTKIDSANMNANTKIKHSFLQDLIETQNKDFFSKENHILRPTDQGEQNFSLSCIIK